MEFSRSRIFRFGTRIKTRYEPHEIYLSFNPEKKGFEFREDPDVERMQQIREMIRDCGCTLNQKAIRDMARESLGFTDRQTRALLEKGAGRYWNVEKGPRNASIYSVLNSFETEAQTPPCEGKTNEEELFG